MTRKSSPSDIPSIACIRCRHRKKKCDHAFPKCGECKRAGSECVRFQERKPRDAASVPWEYVKGLELRLSQVEKSLANCMALIRRQGNPSTRLAAERQVSGTATPMDPVSLGLLPASSGTAFSHVLQPPISPTLTVKAPEFNRVQAFVGNSPSSVASRDGPNSLFRTPVDLQENPFLPKPPSDDDIGLLRRADLACYFQFVHPDWCFLEEEVVYEWYQACVEQRVPPTNYQFFFVQMVCAIGALYSSRSDRGCPHVARSRSLYEQALTQCLPDAVRQTPNLRTKSHLLLLVGAIHSPNAFELRDTISKAMMDISERLSSYQAPASFAPLGAVPDASSGVDAADRALLIHCYFAYEMVVSTWGRQCRDITAANDEKIWNQGIWLTFDGGLMDANFEHIFAIRRLQSKIRRLWKQMHTLNGQPEYRSRNTEEIRAELEQWKGMVPLISNHIDKSTNCHPLSMIMFYDSCICSLYQDESHLPSIEEFSVLLAAASESARCFRRIQEHRPMTYFTWANLSEQFMIGMTLLSCFWGTPYIYRTTAFQSPDTLQALEDCEVTLARFAQRWEAAAVYFDAYKLLLSQTPISFPQNSEFEFAEQLKPQGNSILHALEERGLSTTILSLVNRIVNRPASTHAYS
ncbi:TY1 enhancer activator [Colletotrichum orbiculare MAFF 240422]|uniref:TY1 enhancer activator n=1 Tax=Colletotrichum orbiculare (strain 104-T / ATCC 96160 / CBS 514.97 / LARS 414 / MAFF 240422) TaxID=1213857 RepID=N4VPP6_COLOR|nr:TY1 enhancer activator [Colletotrichum orbiculare MAFF 240422]